MKQTNTDILHQIEEILNIGIALSMEKDHDRLLEMIVYEARRITNADGGTLYLRDGDLLVFKIIQNQTLHTFKGGKGEPIDLPPVPMRLENVSAYAALRNERINIPDVYAAAGFDFSGPKNYDQITGYRTVSMLVTPLENHEGEVIGVLQLINALDENNQPIPFSPVYEKVISSLASQAAISLTNQQLIADIEQLFNSFVEVMATAIDSRTPYNANHTRRVALLSGALAAVIEAETEGCWAEVVFDETRTKQLLMSAWLHDIGKIATPLEVMNKCSRIERRLELILQRLDYIWQKTHSEYLEKKLELTSAGEASEVQLKALEDAWAEQQEVIAQSRALIIRADDPATFVDDAIQQELQQIGARRYADPAGQEQPWLTQDELIHLSVTKGTLTDEERIVMEDHVQVTRRMLDKIPFTTKLKDVPFFAGIHHEHLDGKGYPLGLKGEEIPLEGRILALTDVFDALTAADRPYKKALSIEQSLKILGFMVKDGELDGDLLDLFVKHRVWEMIASDEA
ncbi:MAG TPA: HD domain-containing phosphohydrolase [Syntrophomonas sp.]|nr:HD domain-containing phosphohydrolase [Syntrophomonas sp.]